MTAPDSMPSELSAKVTVDLSRIWGEAEVSSSEEIEESIGDLQADLSSFVSDIRRGPLEQFSKTAHAFFHELRVEFLRHHRRLNVVAREDMDAEERGHRLRAELSELCERFRGVVLSRASRMAAPTWNPTKLVRATERLVEGVPKLIEAPYEKRSLEVQEGDSVAARTARAMLRLRHRWAKHRRPIRHVHLRSLVRQHLADRLVVHLEGVASSFVALEDLVLTHSYLLVDGVSSGYEALVDAGDGDGLAYLLTQFRSDLEGELALAESELTLALDGAALRVARILKDGLAALKTEVPKAGTFEAAPIRATPRSQGSLVPALEAKLAAMRAAQAARMTLLGLDLEYQAFLARSSEKMQTKLRQLGSDVRGRSSTQVVRVLEAIQSTRKELSNNEGLSFDRHGSRKLLSPLSRVVDEALRAAAKLQDQLQAESLATPLLEALNREAQSLSDGYKVPGAVDGRGEWNLPVATAPVVINLGTAVSHYVQSDIAPRLLDALQGVGSRGDGLLVALHDLERVASLDAELLEPGAGPDGEGQIQQVLEQALVRAHTVFEGLEASTGGWADEIVESVSTTVSERLDQFRGRLGEGEVAKLALTAASGADLGISVGRLTKSLDRLGTRSTEMFKEIVGHERLRRARLKIGWIDDEDLVRTAERFAAPNNRCEIPLFYRRLFAPQAHWAPDPRPEHQFDFERVLSALQPRPQAALRTAAITTTHAAVRTVLSVRVARHERFSQVQRLAFNKPASVNSVDEQWKESVGQGQLVVVTGLRWLLSSTPGGAAPLRALISHLLQDRGQNAFLLEAPRMVWRYCSGFAPLEDVATVRVQLRSLERREMEQAIRARHQLSGYQLLFSDGESFVDDGELAQRYFEELHDEADGSFALSLQLFSASLDAVDPVAGTVHVGSLAASPRSGLKELPEDVKLRLHYILRQGWVDSASVCHVEGIEIAAAEGRLERLALDGLLRREAGGVYVVPLHLSPHLVALFQEAGWLR